MMTNRMVMSKTSSNCQGKNSLGLIEEYGIIFRNQQNGKESGKQNIREYQEKQTKKADRTAQG